MLSQPGSIPARLHAALRAIHASKPRLIASPPPSSVKGGSGGQKRASVAISGSLCLSLRTMRPIEPFAEPGAGEVAPAEVGLADGGMARAQGGSSCTRASANSVLCTQSSACDQSIRRPRRPSRRRRSAAPPPRPLSLSSPRRPSRRLQLPLKSHRRRPHPLPASQARSNPPSSTSSRPSSTSRGSTTRRRPSRSSTSSARPGTPSASPRALKFGVALPLTRATARPQHLERPCCVPRRAARARRRVGRVHGAARDLGGCVQSLSLPHAPLSTSC